MKLYRYRTIKNALTEIENRTFHFANREELNDPIEGYVNLYFQGDRPAWEGLLKNYVCSFFMGIEKYLLTSQEKSNEKKYLEEILQDFQSRAILVDIHAFDDVPLGNHLKNLSERFLDDKLVQKLAKCYGDRKLKCSSKELQLILRAVHHKAFVICMRHLKSNNLISDFPEDDYYKELPDFPFEAIEKVDSVERKLAVDVAENKCADRMEQMAFIIKSRHETSFIEKSIPYDHRQQIVWTNIQFNFPKLYVEQLHDVIYPDGYVICFSIPKKDSTMDSAMWGNYAQNHQGICFIYETQEINGKEYFTVDSKKMEVRKVIYDGDVIERNFFTTLGRLTYTQIQSWLTGKDNKVSKLIENFSEDNIVPWSEKYWVDYIEKFHRKNSAWEHEQECRILLHDTLYPYNPREKHCLKYDPLALKGIIFGINTSIDKKFEIIQKIRQAGDKFRHVEFLQAEYECDTQKIYARKKNYL